MNKLLIIFLIFIKSTTNLILFLILTNFFRRKLDHSPSDSILFINTEKFGDLILSIDFLVSFSTQTKFKKKFLLVDYEYTSLLKETILDLEILNYNKKKYRHNVFYRWKTLKNLNNLKLRTVVNISPERGSLNDELTILSRAETTIGLKSITPYMFYYFIKFYNQFYSTFINSNHKNEYTALNDLLIHFDMKPHFPKYSFCVQRIKQPQLKENYILIAPSSSEEFRNWDKYKFRELTKRFSLETKVVLVGTKRQEVVVDFIIDGNTNVNKHIDMNYADLIKLMHNCKLFIGLDSGLSHLALQLDKPTIAIIGGGKHGTFFPYKQNSKNKFLFSQMDCFGCSWMCKYKTPYCISNITVEEVYGASVDILRRDEI